ncbi:MAG: hypothetical protein II581_06780, partial [Oscillospiraceae bacterium]|nr:hypothetical protein [Oscillospiraceae bacterium]
MPIPDAASVLPKAAAPVYPGETAAFPEAPAPAAPSEPAGLVSAGIRVGAFGTPGNPNAAPAAFSPVPVSPAAVPPIPAQSAPAPSAVQYKQTKRKKTGKKSVLPLIAALLALVLIGGGVWYFFLGGRALIAARSELANESQSAIDELADLIQEAEDAEADAIAAYQALTSEGGDFFRDYAAIIRSFQAKVDELQADADEISDLSGKLKQAQEEYFATLHDGCAACVQHLDFYAAYMDFRDAHLVRVPKLENYPGASYYDLSDYSDDLSRWSEKTKQAYAAVSPVPASLRDLWTQYGEIFNLTDSIVQKVDHADAFSDPLSLQSAKNLFNRYSAEIDRQYDKIFACSLGEESLVKLQNTHASTIAQQIRSYAKKNRSERAGFTFTTK